jgi:hypothetical protein
LTRPIRLSDSELDAVFAAAHPLAVADRDPFLQAVAAALAQHRGEIGEGVVYSICREQQRRFFDPPITEDHKHRQGQGKYGRMTG